MSTSVATAATPTVSGRAIAVGGMGGLVGGVVFGLMMQAMGMMPMVAMLAGSESLAVGWAVHLGISALFGAGFGLFAARLFTRPGPALLAGLGYGVLLWVIGPLILMPAKLGMPLFVFDEVALKSLMGHLMYGAVLAGFAVLVARSMNRTEQP